MIWNTPIWLNTLLKIGIVILNSFLPILISIGIIYLICNAILSIKRNKLSDLKKKPYLYMAAAIMVLIGLLFAFYNPQQILPSSYGFNSVYINVETNGVDVFSKVKKSSKLNPIVVEDKQKLEDFTELLNKYKCRRSFENGKRFGVGAVEISLTAYNKAGKSSPLHIVISENTKIRYTSVNNDFIYKIEDKDNTLLLDIVKYIDSL